jgi:hypothetical protein
MTKNLTGWTGQLVLSLLTIFASGEVCGAAGRPTIRVGLGMTIGQMKAGSTYLFKEGIPTFQPMPGQKIYYPANAELHDWMITEPYDLVLVYDGHELSKNDIGGENYLLAITTAPVTRRVESLSITFQNRALTLDEALAEAESLESWFRRVGFHRPSATAPDAREFPEPFAIMDSELYAPKYGGVLNSYADARKAFLDRHAEIVELSAFSLATDDASVGLTITNARRKRENVMGNKDESDAATEHTYFLQLSMIPRPWNRYEGH